MSNLRCAFLVQGNKSQETEKEERIQELWHCMYRHFLVSLWMCNVNIPNGLTRALFLCQLRCSQSKGNFYFSCFAIDVGLDVDVLRLTWCWCWCC